MDKLDAMRSFVEVAAAGSFTQAAERLGISRIRVTRDVQELESWLKLRLLHRTTRRVGLTTAGEEVLHFCEKILNEAASLEGAVRAQAIELAGDIRIAAPIGLGQNLLLSLIHSFTQRHPKVRFQLLLSDKNAQLADDRVDVALRYAVQPSEHLIARRLIEVESVVCAAPEYLQRRGRPREPADLYGHSSLLHQHHMRWRLSRQGAMAEIDLTGVLLANDVVVLLRAALLGMGVACLPCDLANPYIKSGELEILLPEYHMPHFSLWAVYLSRSYQQPLVRAFIDFAAEQWGEDILRSTALSSPSFT